MSTPSAMVTSAPPDPAARYRETHFYVRLLTAVLAVTLFMVSFLYSLATHFPPSISDYYGTSPVRDLFVGSLVGIAACLVAYRGSIPAEEYALNFAGIYAVFVALVPNNLEALMSTPGALPGDFDADDYGTFLRIILLTVVAVGVWMIYLQRGLLRTWWEASGRVGKVLGALTQVAFVLFVLWVVYGLLAPGGHWFGPAAAIRLPGVHFTAAVFLVLSLALVVATYGWPTRALALTSTRPADDFQAEVVQRSYRWWYRLIAIAMLAGAVLIAVLGAWLKVPPFAGHVILAIEWWEILLFATFWIMEMVRERRGGILALA